MDTKEHNDQIGDDQFGNAESTPLTSENAELAAPETTSIEVEKEQELDEQVEEVATQPQAVALTEEDEEKEDIQPISLDDESIDMDSDEEDEEMEDEDIEVDSESNESSTSVHTDYSLLTREELIEALKSLLAVKSVQRIRAEVENIKINFYKKHKAEFERKRKEWVDAGGEIEAFQAPEDAMEPQLKELLKEYKDLKSKNNRELEDEKVKNLEQKLAIIEQIKELVSRGENVSFQEFRELQQRWREIGPVPQSNLNDLWENYHHHVQNFYDFVKINKELRDLDLKKNLEEKIKLCEKAEELLLESSIVNAFKKLQKYHNQWREIGPVPNENKTEIWERFREATSTINKKHQDHFEKLRDEQKVNLDAKTALCEKAEELASTVISSNKEWNKRSKEMIELQKVWKSIGFAPKKDNAKVYERFRTACDSFFANKRDFYEDSREDQQNNLQLKTELCIQAEALKDNSDWKKTSDELIALQKRWKEIGPVPRKHSDEVWKRFRAACDAFFSRKTQHFSQIDNKYGDNLKAKEDLIAEIDSYQVSDDVQANLDALKDFQRRWAEIGYVPIKKKEAIQKLYREALNKHFAKINVDETRKNIMRFKTKMDTVQGKPKQEHKIRQERDRLFNQLKQTENDIILWENNIGFFAKSKNAEQLKKDVEHKIEMAKESIKLLEEKIRLIDSMDSES
jgi:hypothetical protein